MANLGKQTKGKKSGTWIKRQYQSNKNGVTDRKNKKWEDKKLIINKIMINIQLKLEVSTIKVKQNNNKILNN